MLWPICEIGHKSIRKCRYTHACGQKQTCVFVIAHRTAFIILYLHAGASAFWNMQFLVHYTGAPAFRRKMMHANRHDKYYANIGKQCMTKSIGYFNRKYKYNKQKYKKYNIKNNPSNIRYTSDVYQKYKVLFYYKVPLKYKVH